MNLARKRTAVRAAARRPFAVGLALAIGAAAVLAGAGPATARSTAPSARQMSPSFRVATFNVLGALHTTRPSSGFDTYRPRMRRAIRLFDQQSLGIVGLQEFEVEQYDLFMRRTAGAWGVYPGMEEGRRAVQNSIVWRKSEWQRVEAHTFTMKYFHGNLVKEPYVKLRNVNTGATVWVMNTHNPANSHGDATKYRAEDIKIEAGVINSLAPTNIPVVFTGDFNATKDAFCGLTSQAPMISVSGGSWNGSTCVPPKKTYIDWIFTSPSVAHSNYTVLDNAFVHSISDHKLHFADLAVPVS